MPLPSGSPQVRKHEVILPDRTEPQGVRDRGPRLHIVSFTGQNRRKKFPKAGVVVNY